MDATPQGTILRQASPDAARNSIMTSPSQLLRAAAPRRALLALSISALAACGGGGGVPLPPGSIGKPVLDPATGLEFFLDNHSNGSAGKLNVLGMTWGRLVDVYSLEVEGLVQKPVLRHTSFLVGEDIRTDGIDYQLDTNPVTEVTAVTILHSKDDAPAKYLSAFNGLTANLGVIQTKGVDPAELPPFSFVPRNATVQIRFSDLLSPGSINSQALLIRTGNPPTQPQETLVLPDPNYGGLYSSGGLEVFRSTRILIDPTITVQDALNLNPPLQPNSLGYPPSLTTTLPNVAFYFPTEVNPAVGQFDFVRNISGAPLSQTGNGPTEPGSTSVVRSFRSGGDPQVTGDPNNGFLLDVEAPHILGNLPIRLEAVNPVPATSDEYRIDYDFIAVSCGLAPGLGDVLDLSGGVIAQVIEAGGVPVNGQVVDAHVQILTQPATAIEGLIGSVGTLVTQYDDTQHIALTPCFVELSPVSPVPFQPNNMVSPEVSFTIAFSEAMDPASVAAFDTFSVLRSLFNTFDLENLVVGQVFYSGDLRKFRFVPVLPLDTTGTGNYFVSLKTGLNGLSDLSGNGVQETFPAAEYALDTSQGPYVNSGIVLKFSGINEDEAPATPNPGAEIAGQFLIDPGREVVKPRPVARVSGVGDRVSNPMVSNMIPFGPGVQTPLVPLGSRMMTIYRYPDFQWSSTDISNYNMDVEHIAWTPVGGQVGSDSYDLFEMSLSHSSKLPDEAINPSSLLPKYTQSGLFGGAQPFTANALTDPNNTLEVVHPRGDGYVIDPAELFTNVNGTKMIWWPLNRNKALSAYKYYTWRDTAIQGVIGYQTEGIDIQRMFDLNMPVTGAAPGDVAPGDLPPAGGTEGVPSIGMPLLMEFKCFPAQDTAIGLNALDISLAINSSARPNFRAFSSGGYNTSNQAVVKNPDSQTKPDGGFNPGSTPPGKKTNQVADNTFYIGQVEFVVRISRMHTRWFDTNDSFGRTFYTPVIEPNPTAQPLGSTLR